MSKAKYRSRAFVAFGAAGAVALAGTAGAHQDPMGCTGINVSSGLTVTRFDGVSDTSEGITECETVKVTTDLSCSTA